jgi:hypothetical protein
MERERMGGWAMVAGAVMGLVTMGFHPTTTANTALVVGVHALALAATPIAFYGASVLTRRLARAGALSELALAFYALSAVATLLAATASGLVTPALARYAAGGADAGAIWAYNHMLNQAFAQVLVGASSVAIGLWSVEILRSRLLRRATGIMGCAAAVLVLAALFSGHLRMDVHGFGAVVLVQAIWLVMAGLELRRADPAS